MKWDVIMMCNYPHERLEDHPDYWWYFEKHILGEYATKEEAIQAAKNRMVQMGQFQGWADDYNDEYGY